MMNETDIQERINRRLSGMRADAARRERIRTAIHAERQENPPMKKKLSVSMLVVALMLLLASVAMAVSGWDVLSFLGIEADSPATRLITPVAAQAQSGACSIRIESAVTDGQYLAFDWTVENGDPSKPVFIQVDRFTGNGHTLWTDGTDDFHCQWFPGVYNEGMMCDGNLTTLPEAIEGDTLHVEMVIGLYTPDKPVYQMDVFDEALARDKMAEGYYVIAEGEGFVINDPQEGIFQGWGTVNDYTGKGLTRSEMTVSFDLDLAASRQSLRTLTLPEPVSIDGMTMQYVSAASSPLQTSLTRLITPKEPGRDAAAALQHHCRFSLTDAAGSALSCHTLEGSQCCLVQAEDGAWQLQIDLSFITDETLPDVVSLTFIDGNGTSYVAPIAIR